MIWVTLEGTNTLLGAHEFSKADLSGLSKFSMLSWAKNPADLNGRKVIPFAFYNEQGVWQGQPFTLSTGSAAIGEGSASNSSFRTSSSWKIENGKKTTTTTKTYADGRTETSVSVEDAGSSAPPAAPAPILGVGTHVATKWRIEGGKKYISTTTTHPDGRSETVETVEDAPHP